MMRMSVTTSRTLIVAALPLVLILTCCQALETLVTFRDPDGNHFQQVTVHDVTGSVYVGATNRLHRLNPGLTLLQSAATGPREDNPDCPPPLLPCSEKKALLDGVTKGLVIDYQEGTLLLCSTLYHGSCQKLDLANITHVARLIHVPMVPNQASATCVLFVGPSVGEKDALYVGAEYSDVGSKAYRDLVPSISSRSLSDLNLVYRDQDGGTKKTIKDSLRSTFLVKYIHGFVRGSFAYFLTVQKQDVKSDKLVSRIGRVCTKDKYFKSYVEIPLHCEAASLTRYEILQGAAVHPDGDKVVAVFSDVTEQDWDDGKSSSVLCVLDMDKADEEFNRTVEACYAGQGRVGPPQYETKRTCIGTSSDVDMCAQGDVAEAYPSMEGDRPVVAQGVWTLSGQLAKAVTVQSSGQQDVAYVGTADGDLVKVVVLAGKGQEVDRLNVDLQGPVLQVQPSTNMDHIYVLTPAKVSLVWARHCEQRKSCEECVAGGDPMCGWCIMQNRCSAQSNCDSSAVTPSWLPAATASCARMTNVQPEVVSYESLQSSFAEKRISFQLDQVSVSPGSNLDLGCMFESGDTKHRTKATIQNSVITCPLPERAHLPSIPQDHENMVLHFHVQGKSIVTRSVSVYDCRSNTDCGSCTNSSYRCQWCYASGTCLKQADDCPEPKSRPGITSSNSCPLITMSSQDKDILVHAGEQRQIAVQVRNLEDDQKSNIKCRFFYLGKNTTVNGAISPSSSLTCDPVEFDYPDREQLPYTTADFTVTWGPQALPLDNSEGINVRIYKCPLLVTNCGKCLSMDAEYECGWCSGKCTLQKRCPNNWLDRTATCPGPQILRFQPATGPIKGKTSMSVTGLNLGKTYTDITGGITVAGINCDVKPDHYEPSSGFVCETEVSDTPKSGTIVVVVDGQYTAESDSTFSFVDPVVKELMPKEGPRAGGTTVMIKGMDIDAGSVVSVTMGGATCKVIKRNHTMLQCVTPKQAATTSDKVNVEVSFGGHKKTVPEQFTYKDDPNITMIEPTKSILSGGTYITVMGEGLNLIQNPSFFVTYGGKFFSAPCNLDNPITMECEVPEMAGSIASAGVNVTETSPLEVHYGFNMDGVMTLKNVSHRSNFGPLLLFPNPQIMAFPGDDQTKQFGDQDMLVIKGRFRIISNLMASVSVLVGNEKCEEVGATDTAITCRPPPSTPDGTDSTGKAPVQVRVGNLAVNVGYLRYYEVSSMAKPMALGVILGVVIPILAIIILLTVCVLRRHRKHKPATDYIPDVLQDYQGAKEEEEIGLNHVAVADVNGTIGDEKDCGPYITELLAGFEGNPHVRQNITAMLIPRSRLDIGELIGKGHFGAVYKAQLQRGEDKSAQVAVKTLQAKSSETETLQKFLQEVAMLKNLTHPHLLPVVGVCLTASDDPMVVCPFMATEDLKSYIGEPSKKLTVVELLAFGQQITDGMVYLQGVKVVHGNLAARNCIVTEDQRLRLTDYGVTSALFPQPYYTAEDSPAKELVKWMAPETIEHFQFSTKSDVWAFGIVLWELLTRGITPYPDVDNASLLAYLKEGKRMKKPRQSPEPVYEIMVACWTESPDQRPDFTYLNDQLKSFVATENGTDDATSQLLKDSVEVGGSTEYLEVIG
nr:hypothetical protein BaRGS_031876 [Batillaria attramentaria]